MQTVYSKHFFHLKVVSVRAVAVVVVDGNDEVEGNSDSEVVMLVDCLSKLS